MNSPRQQEFGSGLLYQITNWIYWLLVLNICFVGTNIFFLLAVITLTPDLSNIIFYYLSLILSGPSIAALLYSTLQLIQEKEETPLRDFFRAYRINLKDTLRFWVPVLTFFCIGVVNIKYLSIHHSVLNEIISMALLLLYFFLAIVTIQAFVINSKLSFKTLDLFKVAIYTSVKHLKITVGNFSILFLFWFLFNNTSDFLMLFLGSFMAYLILLNSRKFLSSVENQFCHKE